MLVLTRKVGESIVIDGNIKVKVQRVSGKRVTVAIEAPGFVKILRGEIQDDLALEGTGNSVSDIARV